MAVAASRRDLSLSQNIRRIFREKKNTYHSLCFMLSLVNQFFVQTSFVGSVECSVFASDTMVNSKSENMSSSGHTRPSRSRSSSIQPFNSNLHHTPLETEKHILLYMNHDALPSSGIW